MGREIALVFALSGREVTLCDQTDAALAGARERLSQIVEKGVARGFYGAEAGTGALSRIHTTMKFDAMSTCDYVTEAVFEREDVKAAVYSELDRACSPDCIIATNTSTIPISVLASHLPESRRRFFVGTHYFSPVSRMRLVEVMPGIETSTEVLQATLELSKAIGKTPISVKDVPGFAVNRLLHAFIIEAIRLVEENVASPEDIDTACRLGLGHPMGPFELMDATTSGLVLQVQEILHEIIWRAFSSNAAA